MKKIIWILGIIALSSILIFIFDCIQHIDGIPIKPYGNILLKDSKGRILTDKGTSGGYGIPGIDTLKDPLIQDIVSIEDARFYTHHGIDIYGKLGSIWQNIRAGGIVRGGSTITEQYIKNAYYSKGRRTVLQKIREAIGALYIEQIRTKEEILTGYLESLYFGNRIYGIAGLKKKYYLNTPLTDDDILDTITRIKFPNITESKKQSILAYREKIKNKLNKGSDATRLFEEYSFNSIERFPLITEKILYLRKIYCAGKKDPLLRWVKKIEGDICKESGINITLTLDGDLMEFSRIALESTLASLSGKNVTNGGIYIIRAKDKKILTYIPNRQDSPLGDTLIDMIVEKRSVGSVLKPFIYLLALKEGHDMNDLILDESRVYPTGQENKGFVPLNYVEKSYGPVRLREALGNSLNSSTVRLVEELGIGRVYDFFRENGIVLERDVGYYGYGIALGGIEDSLENIVDSYIHLTDLSDPNNFLLHDSLKDAGNRSKTFGVSSILNTSIPLAVKTGTSTDFRDNWTLSYGPDVIIGVWVGNSDNSPMKDVSGVSGAGPLWHSIAEYMITRGFIRSDDDEGSLPSPLKVTNLCLDRNCLRKEVQLSKKGDIGKSRPIENIYYESDFVTRMTREEKEKWNIRTE